ncbi:HlyD family type I secretion periplasmic adaptor subunit [Solidesulfovibrio alcoholivorans]|uniref:HlyD family type I secretion periplasmic adaptor subunit n=1 Tax=Solidesulfovibrio alcoholivorans TaxID=81406 RepID=UPI000497C498|nr:HlyD family type I secretion periplasmic adaptor subunit [Solidesulfovibrio alcoholivorans]
MIAPWKRKRPPAVATPPGSAMPAPRFAAFQPPALEILAAPVPVRYRATLYLLLAFFLCALLFACLAKVDRIVAAPGKLVSARRNVAVASPDGGVIRDIRVTAGQTVGKGDPLVTLDPTLAEAGLAERDKEERVLAAKVWRLTCETGGSCAAPKGLSADDLRLERELLAARRKEYDAKLEALDRRVGELSAKLATNAAEAAKNKKQITLARDLERMYGDIYKQGASSKVEYMKAQSQRIEAEGQLTKLGNEAGELHQSLARAEAEKRDFQTNRAAEDAGDLAQASRDLAAAEEQRRKAAHLREQVVLRAPESGTVLDVAAKAAGAVAGAGETLLTLVPQGDSLVLEAEVAAQDIGRVRPGDAVRIKFDAFPFQRHGTASGTVATISPDALEKQTPEGQRLFYRVRAAVTDAHLTDVPPDFHLFPGLSATAEIKVGARRVITYLAYPLVRAFDESLREP